jgi:hypothetical protein
VPHRTSLIHAALTQADIDVGLGKRHSYYTGPDYWHEPYFYPDYPFGWFHDGPFSEGDRCWQEGRYGSVLGSLCILVSASSPPLTQADLDLGLNVKRAPLLGLDKLGLGELPLDDSDLLSRGLFRDGDKCWHDGRWVAWRGIGCDALDLDLDLGLGLLEHEHAHGYKRGAGQLFRDDPWLGRGVPCTREGIQGILRDSICVVVSPSEGRAETGQHRSQCQARG